MTKVLVIGDIIVDQYITALDKTNKTEAGGSVYDGISDLRCGGAALAAEWSQFADTSLVGIVGDDIYGKYIEERMRIANVDTSGMMSTCSVDTLLKIRAEDPDSRSGFRVDTGGSVKMPQHIKARLRTAVASTPADAVLISDYEYGVWDALKGHVKFKCSVVVDPGRTRDWSEYPKNTTVITPNEAEYENHNVKHSYAVATTMGKGGVYIRTSGGGFGIPGWHIEPTNKGIGGGDVFSVALATYLGQGMSVRQAAARANLTAAKFVGNCDILDGENEKIVFTNGCFDMLHEGHVSLLKRAKEYGDRLVVGLNDDTSVARLKGGNRPIVGVDERRAMLEALECVDDVIVFSEDTPLRLLAQLAPDVLVKGGKTRPIGADTVESYGGKVVTLQMLSAVSTTSRIESLQCQ